ncbi:transcription termination factor 4, mitochondrial isoform X2 [Pseudophryne corroboree]|uniref:transcription termination factor 4, mitochondrial isoform X2 n=1 Tax=Pseudophryne corroboree TaxID=495146 RepID=UPI003081FCD3
MVSLCLRHVLAFSRPSLRHLSSVPNARQELLALGFSETQTERIESMRCPLNRTSTIRELCLIGLSHRMVLRMLEERPELLRTPAKDVRDRVDTLRSLGLGEGSIQNSLSRCPSLLSVPRSRLLASAQSLKGRCQFSSQQVQKILNTVPETLTQDPTYVEEVFQYVYFRMGMKHGEIISSNVFLTSLNEIRVRHQFLERLGRFLPPDKKGLCPSSNPKLKEITQLSEEDFLSRIACSSAEELSTFRKIMEREQLEMGREDRNNMRDEEDELSSEDEQQSDSEDDSEDEDDEGNARRARPNLSSNKKK